MEPWNITLSATLDRPVPQHEAFALGQRIAGDSLLSVVVHDSRFATQSAHEIADPVALVAAAPGVFTEKLAEAGYTVKAWEAIECLSGDETERRLESSSIPPLINAKEFAALCGFTSHQRIYELETERRKAAEEGRPHPFPTPVVPSWWIKTAAERYAKTRKRKPGPAPKGD